MFALLTLLALSLACWLGLRALNNFQPGHFGSALWQPTGGALVTVQIKEHTVDISVLLHDVTHGGTGGVRARIAGPLDAAGTVNADLDLDAPPYGPVALFPGVRGVTGLVYVPAKGPLQIPCRVEKVHYALSMEKEISYSFDVKIDALSGIAVYPAL